MPHRKLWNWLIHPATLTNGLLITGVAIVLAVIMVKDYHDQQQAMQQNRRWEAVVQSWPAIVENTRKAQDSTEQITQNTKALIEMSKAIQDVANILKTDRETRTKEHQELLNRSFSVKPLPQTQKRSRKLPLRRVGCYTERTERHGDTVVVVRDVVPCSDTR